MKIKINFIIAIAFVLMITFSLNINAVDNNINKSIQIETIESTSENGEYLKEAELNERLLDEENNEAPSGPTTFAASLTIPEEGSWDPNKTKDIKDSSGKIVERRFYSSKNVLMEKRFYIYKNGDRIMDEKYLYWSDGQTLERKRDYGYLSSSDKYYIITTRKYRDDSTRQWTLNYEGKNSDIYENQYVYNQAGTYYLYKVLYNGKTSNIQTQRLYYQGKLVDGSNRITHVGDYNATGTKWVKVTYYKSYTNDIKTRIVKYTGDDPDNKIVYIWYYDEDSQELTNTTYYDTTGQYIDFKTKWQNGKKIERTYYNKNEDGKINLICYYDNLGINIFTDIKYENGIILYEKTYNNDGSYYIDFYEGNKKNERVIYGDENNEIFNFQYDELGEDLFADTTEFNLSEEEFEKLESLEYKMIVDYTKGTYIIEQKNEDDLEEDLAYDIEMEKIDELDDDEEYISEEESSFINSDTTEEDVDQLIDENPEFTEEIVDEYLLKTFEDELIKEDVTESDYEKINQLMSQLTPEEIEIINETIENDVSDEEGTEILINILKEKEISEDTQEVQARFIFPVVKFLVKNGPKLWKGIQTVGKVAKNYGTKAINWVDKQFNCKKAVNNSYIKKKSNPKIKYTKRTTKAENINKSAKQKFKNNKKQKQKSVVTYSNVNKLPNKAKEMYDKYEKAGWKGNLPDQTKGTTAGKKWNNKSNQLPNKGKDRKPITYKYFDINNKIAGQKKDGKRFIKGSNGSIYYTSNHYKTFKKLK